MNNATVMGSINQSIKDNLNWRPHADCSWETGNGYKHRSLNLCYKGDRHDCMGYRLPYMYTYASVDNLYQCMYTPYKKASTTSCIIYGHMQYYMWWGRDHYRINVPHCTFQGVLVADNHLCTSAMVNSCWACMYEVGYNIWTLYIQGTPYL